MNATKWTFSGTYVGSGYGSTLGPVCKPVTEHSVGATVEEAIAFLANRLGATKVEQRMTLAGTVGWQLTFPYDDQGTWWELVA